MNLVMSLLLMLPADVPALAERLAAIERQRIELVSRVAPSVIAIFGPKGAAAGGGSGVLISADGYALTNFHVTRGTGPHQKCGLPDGSVHDAVIVGIDPVGDVALIQLLGRIDFPHVRLGDSDTLRLADPVVAMGNPFLLATDFTPTVTAGIVSGLHRYQAPSGTLLEYADSIQTDASINPGNSGGPLFNMAGDLVGINGRISFEKRARVNAGIGYAISINQIKLFLDHLRGGLIVDHATLGATVTSDADGRVLVSDVLEDSDVYRRGLRINDELVTFAGRPMGSVNAFKNVLGTLPRGWRVELTYRRAEVKQTIQVRLAGVHAEGKVLPTPSAAPARKQGESPPGRGPVLPKVTRRVPAMPVAVRQHYEEKPGFANYHYSKLWRDRLLSGIRRSDMGSLPATWIMTLADPAGKELTVTFNDAAVVWTTPQGVARYDAGTDGPDPLGAGGLLVALDQWRQLLRQGTTWFSRFEFAGGLPMADGSIALTLTGERGGIRSTWICDRNDGSLLGLETVSGRGDDPCEVGFNEYRPVNGTGPILPHHWTVRHAGDLIGQWKLVRAEFMP